MKNKRSLIIRIIAIGLCALMLLGVVTAAISAYAVSPMPATGSSSKTIWIAVAAVVAVAVVAVCLISAKKKK
ncbi:MAG: LPXTG cell wall anchor domain-containing protein [Clostridia bacterium]|nr:LPXTG cell wall anchor domain-containing protein [Clostridia bacterium]